MNEELLASALDEPVPGEPPLGFDPDEVVTRAGVRRQRRGATLLAGIGALVALAGITTGVTLTSSHNQVNDTQPASRLTVGPTTTSYQPPPWPPAGFVAPTPSRAQVSLQWNAAMTHLGNQLSALLPGLKEVIPANRPTILPDPLHQDQGLPYPVSLGGYRVGAGVGDMIYVHTSTGPYALQVTMATPVPGTKPASLAGLCQDELALRGHGYQVSCTYQPVRGEGTVVLMEAARATDTVPYDHQVAVADYRPNGTMVAMTSVMNDPSIAGAFDILPKDLLLKLATDPVFNLG